VWAAPDHVEVAIATAVTGAFGLGYAVLSFLGIAVGGVLIGLVVGTAGVWHGWRAWRSQRGADIRSQGEHSP
jgi:NhaP-type Na+/H+ or K+/H+ antiporter